MPKERHVDVLMKKLVQTIEASLVPDLAETLMVIGWSLSLPTMVSTKSLIVPVVEIEGYDDTRDWE